MPIQFIVQLVQRFAAGCTEHSFLGLPVWYHYLNAAGKLEVSAATGHCEFVTFQHGFKFENIALIGLGVVDILLRISVYITIGYVMYGGFRMITAQGEPDGMKRAQQTIWNALIGLGIALAAVGGVAFIGKTIQ